MQNLISEQLVVDSVLKVLCKHGTDVDWNVILLPSSGSWYARMYLQDQLWILSPVEFLAILSRLSSSMQDSSPINSQNHNLFSPPKKQDPSYSGRLIDGRTGLLESLIRGQ